MIEISLAEFVDFVTKAGSPKLTVVRKVRQEHAAGYDPAKDFYKKLRDGIVKHHQLGKSPTSLDALAAGVTDKNKVKAYPIIIQGYKRFLGRRAVTWFAPPKKTWTHGGLAVRVNPELGLVLDSQPHLIKMYWKQKQLRKLEVPTIMHLLQLVLASKKDPNTLGLLDVRRGRLLTPDTFDPGLTALLEGEATSFATIYRAL